LFIVGILVTHFQYGQVQLLRQPDNSHGHRHEVCEYGYDLLLEGIRMERYGLESVFRSLEFCKQIEK
jgi:hypothetical protein